MQVKIKNKSYQYDPPLGKQALATAGWKHQAGPYFKINEQVGNELCFVKRFEHPPSALALLQKIKDRNDAVNIMKVYDVIKTSELNKPIYYLFAESLKGKLLEEIDYRKVKVEKFFWDILEALSFLHQKEFWFGDFDNKNILVSPDYHNYYLIDIDSCWHHNQKPAADEHQTGGIPAQDLSNLALNFYRKELKQKVRYGDISGQNLNYLQLLFLTCQLFYFQKVVKQEPQETYQGLFKGALKKREELVFPFIKSTNENYLKAIFLSALERPLQKSIIAKMGKFILEGKVQTQPNPTPKPSPIKKNPKIEYFKASQKSIVVGSTLILSWNVKDASIIKLNGKTVSAQYQLKVSPIYPTIYTLFAQGVAGQSIFQKVEVQVIPKSIPSHRPRLAPVIYSFTTTSDSIKKKENITLKWHAKNIQNLSIKFNGKILESNLPVIGERTFTPKKTGKYELLAEGFGTSNASQDLPIKVKRKGWRWLWILLILAILGTGIAFSSPVQRALEERNWEKAEKENSIVGYQNYVEDYPKGHYSNEARRKIDYLKKKAAWEKAKSRNTIEGYQDYIKVYPSGSYADEARKKIESFEEETAWEKAKSMNTIEGYQSYIDAYPNGSYVAIATSEMKEIEWNTRVKSYPSYRKGENGSNWRIVKVYNTDDYTVIEMVVKSTRRFDSYFNKPGRQDSYFIKANNNKYLLKKTANVPAFYPQKLPMNDNTITLYFDKLPTQTNKFDLIEGSNHPRGMVGINFYDIDFSAN